MTGSYIPQIINSLCENLGIASEHFIKEYAGYKITHYTFNIIIGVLITIIFCIAFSKCIKSRKRFNMINAMIKSYHEDIDKIGSEMRNLQFELRQGLKTENEYNQAYEDLRDNRSAIEDICRTSMRQLNTMWCYDEDEPETVGLVWWAAVVFVLGCCTISILYTICCIRDIVSYLYFPAGAVAHDILTMLK